MASSSLNPRTTKREFFGVPGALAVTTVVPVVSYALYFGCSEKTGGCPPPYAYSLEAVKEAVVSSVTDVNWWKGLWDNEAAILYFGWYAFCVVAWAILPGDWIEGTKLRNGKRLQYKINGECHARSGGIQTNVSQLCQHFFSPWASSAVSSTETDLRFSPSSTRNTLASSLLPWSIHLPKLPSSTSPLSATTTSSSHSLGTPETLSTTGSLAVS